MRTLVTYAVIGFFFLLMVSCSSTFFEEIRLCDNQNIEMIKGIARKYGYNNIQIDYDGQRFTPLTKEEIECYDRYFEELRKLDGSTFKVTKSQSVTRALESFSYMGGVGYEGHSYKVAVYWMKDNQTGEICNVEGGLGGTSLDVYPYPEMIPPLAAEIMYTLVYQGKVIHGVGGGIIDITLRGDLKAGHYKKVNGRLVFESMNYNITTKIAAYGKVDTNSFSGSFAMQSAGSGSWIGRDEL